MGFHLIIFSKEVARNKSYGRGAPGIHRWIGDFQVKCISGLQSPRRFSTAPHFILKR